MSQSCRHMKKYAEESKTNGKEEKLRGSKSMFNLFRKKKRLPLLRDDVSEDRKATKTTTTKDRSILPLLAHLSQPPSRKMPDLLKFVGHREGWLVEPKQLKCAEKPFASGSCAYIFKADYHGLEVCVKQVKNPENKILVEDIHREIALWRTLRHPNIVPFLGACFHPTYGCQIITEHLEGGDLASKMRNGGFSTNKAVRVGISIAQALAYLHAHKPPILHRDMKPANIFFDGYGKAKLADFGLSRLKAGQAGKYEMTGKTGTIRYMAPEVVRGEKYDESVDIFSFGLILCFIITKEAPFSAYDRQQRIRFAMCHTDYKVKVYHRLEPIRKNIIERCTADDSKVRPTAVQCVEELSKVHRRHKIDPKKQCTIS
ncbi:hypothetical protein AAMO2058_001192000 [Amorphochlora amoebiformis]